MVSEDQVDQVDQAAAVDAVDAVAYLDAAAAQFPDDADVQPLQEEPAGAPAPGAELAVGTYALYAGDRGGLVLVVQDGRSGAVQRYRAPAPLVAMARRLGARTMRQAGP